MPLVLKPRKRTSEIDAELVRTLAEYTEGDELFARILYSRGLDTPEKIHAFLSPSARQLHDPMLMKNMDVLAERLSRAQGQKIVVYGDYDVDGTCAVTILCEALKRVGLTARAYVPDRKKEGYGLNENALEQLFDAGCELLITVDCGIASAELIARQLAKGREIIVTDHHSIGETFPTCPVIKPGQPGDEYPNPDLCGAGIAFKIAQALLGEKADDLVDLAGLATVADVVPLKDENRALVKLALDKMNDAPRPCFTALLKQAGFEGTVTAQTVGFVIAPRLNAAGRMESAQKTLDFLSGTEPEKQAEELDKLNVRRQETEKEIAACAEEAVADTVRDSKVLVACGDNWDEGVIGICAARLCEKYKRPCLLFSCDETGKCKGSGRSVEGVNLFEMLSACREHLTQFGGHAMAAGMSTTRDKLDALRAAADRWVRENCDLRLLYPTALYDVRTTMDKLTPEFCRHLEWLEPCGQDNPEVSVRVDKCACSGLRVIGQQQNHLKLTLDDGTASAGAVAFRYENIGFDFFTGVLATAIVRPEINRWQGRESVSLVISRMKENENLNPRHYAGEGFACFFHRLSYPRTGKARITWVQDTEELSYKLSEWAQDDVAGTLILADHPDFAAGARQVIEEEAPRFDVALHRPPTDVGYHALVMAADAESLDLRPYRRVIFYDLVNPGYADFLAERFPWLEFYALTTDETWFDGVFEEFRMLDREQMSKAYRALTDGVGTYASRRAFLEKHAERSGLNQPLLSAALDVFCELGFLSVEGDMTLRKNPNPEKRPLTESRYYQMLLKSLSRRSQ